MVSMCGIFTILNNFSRFTGPFIDEQFNKGVYRGPDNSKLRKEVLNFILGFHRLSINGLDEVSNQPLVIDDIFLICNGEIYNHKALYDVMNIKPKTNSDCEVIIQLYKDFGMEQTLRMLDGVFAFILVDLRIFIEEPLLYVARDPFGVRPLYILDNNDKSGSFTGFASEAKCLTRFHQDLNKNILTKSQQRGINNVFAKTNKHNLKHFPPGHYSCYKHSTNVLSSWKLHLSLIHI